MGITMTFPFTSDSEWEFVLTISEQVKNLRLLKVNYSLSGPKWDRKLTSDNWVQKLTFLNWLGWKIHFS